MDRRDFLKILLATPIAATYDFEHLLWVPKPMVVVPAKTIPPQIWLYDWGKRFVYVDYKGIVHYACNYGEVDKIMNECFLKWRENR